MIVFVQARTESFLNYRYWVLLCIYCNVALIRLYVPLIIFLHQGPSKASHKHRHRPNDYVQLIRQKHTSTSWALGARLLTFKLPPITSR